MRTLLYTLFILIQTTELISFEYAIDAKANNDYPIISFKIFGERNSGTNFLEELVQENLLSNAKERLPYNNSYSHKHYPCWFELPLEFYHCPRCHYTFEGSENVLFLVIYRNPYDWLSSMHAKPFDSRQVKRFSTFIRSPWELDPSKPAVKHELEKNPWVDRNPENGALFANVIQLRSAKIRAMQQVKDRVENIYYIKYETLKDHPEEVLQEMKTLFQLKKTKVYHPVLYYKGTQNLGLYKQRTYPPILPWDRHFINAQLDIELEQSIGYELE